MQKLLYRSTLQGLKGEVIDDELIFNVISSNLADARVYLFSGLLDTVVDQGDLI